MQAVIAFDATPRPECIDFSESAFCRVIEAKQPAVIGAN